MRLGLSIILNIAKNTQYCEEHSILRRLDTVNKILKFTADTHFQHFRATMDVCKLAAERNLLSGIGAGEGGVGHGVVGWIRV
jgi:hypothetical protein